MGVGEHETVSSSDFLSVRREIYGKLKTLTKYSKIKSQVQSENGAPTDPTTTTSKTSATTTDNTNNKTSKTNASPSHHLGSKSPRPPRASLLQPQQQQQQQQQQHQSTTSSSRHVPSSTTDISSSSQLPPQHPSRRQSQASEALPPRESAAETEDEASSSCEKHTGKDSGIEDEDTPRESERGSKLSLIESNATDYDERTIVEEEDVRQNNRKTKGETRVITSLSLVKPLS